MELCDDLFIRKEGTFLSSKAWVENLAKCGVFDGICLHQGSKVFINVNILLHIPSILVLKLICVAFYFVLQEEISV